MHIDHDCTCSNWWVLIEVLSGLILHINSGDEGGMETPMSRGLKQFDQTVERIDDYEERFVSRMGL